MISSKTADWLIPSALIALAAIPILAGTVRLTALVSGGPISESNVRFIAAPLPITLHIVSVILFSVLGAFQFAPAFRARRPDWHRAAGRIVAMSGLVAGLSGIWMALFYAIIPADSTLLQGFRLFFGAAMVASIVNGFLAIRRRDIVNHQAWMRRAYAIGLGAGTQAVTQLPFILIFGRPFIGLGLALMMGGAWILNLIIAEWMIQRQTTPAFQIPL